MRGLATALFWGTVALSLHVAALWLAVPAGGGGGGGGDAGQAAISVAAAGPSRMALVAEWEAAPDPGRAPDAPPSPQIVRGAPSPEPLPEPAAGAVPVLRQDPPARARLPELSPAQQAPAPVAMPTEAAPPPEPVVTDEVVSLRPPERPADISDTRPDTAPEPVARAAPQPAAALRAAGTGPGAQAGAAGAAATGLSPGQQQALMAQWGGAIRARVERAARRPNGAQGDGQVRLGLTVARDGGLVAVRVTGSSGDPALDRAALDAVRRAGRLPPAPGALPGAQHDFALPVSFPR